MKRTDPKTVRQIIDAVFDRAAISDRYARERASAMWPDIVGPGVTRLTTRRYVTDDAVLHVHIASASLKNELLYSRASILRAINGAMGREVLREIRVH